MGLAIHSCAQRQVALTYFTGCSTAAHARPTCAMAMTMHVTHDQHVVKAATLAHDELSRSQVMHWHAYGPLWWPVVALMTRPQHLEHHPWTTEHGGVARCTEGLVCLRSW